jgi:hypothetical protein
MRLWFFVMLVCLLALVPGTATGQSTAALTVKPNAVLVAGGGAPLTMVSVRCTLGPGDKLLESLVSVSQVQALGLTSLNPTCDGKRDRIDVQVPTMGQLFEPGAASASAFLLFLDPRHDGVRARLEDDQAPRLLSTPKRRAAIVGRPVARLLQNGTRPSRALGYRCLVTYTLPVEGGASLSAAGWRLVGEAGGSWKRRDVGPSRSTPDRADAPVGGALSGSDRPSLPAAIRDDRRPSRGDRSCREGRRTCRSMRRSLRAADPWSRCSREVARRSSDRLSRSWRIQPTAPPL